MAQRIVIQSDFDGSELKEAEHESVRISYGGNTYELDGTAHQIETALKDYLTETFRVKNRTSPLPSKRGPRSNGASGLSREELAEARAWLSENGFAVSDRGRIRGELLTKWQQRGAGAPARAQKTAESKSAQSSPAQKPAENKSAQSSQTQPTKK